MTLLFFILHFSFCIRKAVVAQLAERRLPKPQVAGSNPVYRSMSNNMTYSQMAQLELMNAAANVNSQEDLDALKLTISLFFAEKAQREIDQMWEDGTFNQEKLDELRGQHLRTLYIIP